MDCEQYTEWISAALDGECTAEERRLLEEHLAVCPRCAQLFDTLSRQTDCLRSLDCRVPDDLKQNIMENLPARESAKRGKVLSWKRWVPAVAAACLVLVAVMVPGARSGSEPAAVNSLIAPSSQPYAGPRMETAADAAEGTGSAAPQATLTEAPCEPEVDACDLSDPLSIRVSYGMTPAAPTARAIVSAEELQEFLSLFSGDDLAFLLQRYDEAFFAANQLVAAVVEESSGSVQVVPESLTGDTLTLRRLVPEVGTCDMAAWLILAETDCIFPTGQELALATITQNV